MEVKQDPVPQKQSTARASDEVLRSAGKWGPAYSYLASVQRWPSMKELGLYNIISVFCYFYTPSCLLICKFDCTSIVDYFTEGKTWSCDEKLPILTLLSLMLWMKCHRQKPTTLHVTYSWWQGNKQIQLCNRIIAILVVRGFTNVQPEMLDLRHPTSIDHFRWAIQCK